MLFTLDGVCGLKRRLSGSWVQDIALLDALIETVGFSVAVRNGIRQSVTHQFRVHGGAVAGHVEAETGNPACSAQNIKMLLGMTLTEGIGVFSPAKQLALL
jgi:hypothetical protein